MSEPKQSVQPLEPQQFQEHQKQSYPTPSQPEVIAYQALNLAAMSTDTLLATVKQLIICSNCNKTFDRAVICDDYMIQLNRPIQCACGCVTCTLCYRAQRGCRIHNASSSDGHVNTAVSNLACCPVLANVGEWDLELEINDTFKTDDEVDSHVQNLMNETQVPGATRLREIFKHLNIKRDSMSFKYWINEAMPEEVAYRYVCIPHIPGFWDHVLVGTRTPPRTEKMIGPDEYLPKLFNASLGVFNFHWCCFVLKKQIILAMWCTSKPRVGHPKVFSIVDSALKSFTATIEFRRMVFYLSRWFTAQYKSPAQYEAQVERRLNVVLDCKPSEGSLVNIISLLAFKSGMEKVMPGFPKPQVADAVNYRLNLKNANLMFTCPNETTTVAYIDIVEEFKVYSSDLDLCQST